MNPTLEVQITAKLDKLDAGLKVAEAKVNQSAVTMGKAGEQGGNAFVDNLANKVIKGTAILGVTQALGGVLLNAVKGMNAQKSGEEIMKSIADGLVAQGKNLPVVGLFYAAFEEVINGADRFAEELTKKLGSAIERRIDATKTLMNMLKASATKTEDIKQAAAAGKDPLKMLDEEKRKNDIADQQEFNDKQQAEDIRNATERGQIEAKSDAAGLQGSNFYNREIRQAQIEHLAKIAEIQKDADNRVSARQAKFQADKNEIDKKQADEKVKTAEAAQKAIEDADKANKVAAYEMGNEMVADWKVQQKEKYEAAVQAQQDIIDAEQTAQAQIDKIGRVDQMAGQAAQGMINSGQTALGQFNFAQAGAGGTALEMAKKQVMSLEKIEAATAEQVRLTKENKGFQ
jgi:hypothetical protein